MSVLKTSLSLLFLFLATLTFSQVEILGEMKLGDTTQVHVLNTKNGDRMVGRVVGFNDTHIDFIMLGNKLSFPIGEVVNIQVQDRGTYQGERNEDEYFQYQINMKSGRKYKGILLGYLAQKIFLRTSKEPNLKLKTSEIESIQHLGSSVFTDSSEVKQFHALKMYQGQPLEGQVIHYKDGQWEFLVANDETLTFSNKQLMRIDLLKNSLAGEDKKTKSTVSIYGKQEMRGYTRNYAAPTGFMLAKGESEYRNTQIVYNTVDHGLTENVTIGGTIIPIFRSAAIGARMKIGASLTEKFHVAVGGTATLPFGQNVTSGLFTTFYGAFTLGTKANNLTFSLGRYNDSSDDSYNTLTLAGSVRTGQKSRLFIEYNHLAQNRERFANDFSLTNVGFSWFKGKNRVDFGFAVTVEDDFWVPIPMAAYSLYF